MLEYYQQKKVEHAALVQAALSGDAEAAYRLAHDYYWRGFKNVVEKNPQLCFQYADQAAQAGHLEAETFCAYLYVRGIGVDQQQARGISALQDARKKGSIRAAGHLAHYYMYGGGGLPLDPATGMQIYKDIFDTLMAQATAGANQCPETSAVVHYPLGLLLGIGVEKDTARATALLQEASALGFDRAAEILRHRRAYIFDIPYTRALRKDTQSAVYYPLEGILEPTPGQPLHSVAANLVDDILYRGGHDAALLRREYQALKRAAMQGDVAAAYELGARFYKNGRRDVAPENHEMAFRYVDQAARAGHLPALAERAEMYLGGIGVPRQMDLGFAELEKAYQLGSREAGANLARRLMRGWDIEQDLSRGCAIYQDIHAAVLAEAKAGRYINGIEGSLAATKYPLCLIFGIGVKQDEAKGAALLRELAAYDDICAEAMVRQQSVYSLDIPGNSAMDMEVEYVSLASALSKQP